MKPGDQTDETESPKLVNKTGLQQTGEYLPKLSLTLFSISTIYKIFPWEPAN